MATKLSIACCVALAACTGGIDDGESRLPVGAEQGGDEVGVDSPAPDEAEGLGDLSGESAPESEEPDIGDPPGPWCDPVPEICDNGIDDDCDELIDEADDDCDEEQPPCTNWQTVTCAIPNCNTHMGDNEAECYSWGNAGGCTQLQLQAWCTRRVNEGPTGLWYQIHEQWVDDQCDGTVSFESNQNDVYVCEEQSTCIRYECQTPLVLVFDPAERVAFESGGSETSFDLAAPDEPDALPVDWPTAATPWLALDRDGDGRITSGEELFGSASPVAGGTALNGFEALATLDENGDGRLDATDAGFHRIVTWADQNHDRISQPDELRPLAALGIETLELGFLVEPHCDARGNCEVERARFTWRDDRGVLRQGAIVDVHLRTRRHAPAWCPL